MNKQCLFCFEGVLVRTYVGTSGIVHTHIERKMAAQNSTQCVSLDSASFNIYILNHEMKAAVV